MKNFIGYVKIGKFIEAKEFIARMSDNEIYSFIVELGFDTNVIVLYTFVNFLLMKKETAALHCCAAALITLPFVYIEYSYSMGIFHARRCVELAPQDPSYKEYLLSYYGIPDKLLSREEAIEVAKALAQQDPDNVAADHFFQDIKDGTPDYLKK